MADTNLGNLAYRLSLDKKDFERDIKMLRSELDALYKHRTVNLSGINKNSLHNIQQAIDKSEFKIKKLIIDPNTTRNSLQRQIDKLANELVAKININLSSSEGKNSGLQAVVQESSRATAQEERRKEATDDANKSLNDSKKGAENLTSSLRQATSQATTLAGVFNELRPIIGEVLSLYGIKRFIDGLIDVGGEIQKQRLSLGKLLQSDTDANYLFEQMKELAVKSPFGLLDLTSNARQLSAFGTEYNKLYDTMKRLSDIAAGLGIQFGRLSLVYGETMERGFLDGKLVRQFSYMGLPILQKIADYYTQIDKAGNGKAFDASMVRKMVSNREVSFEDVDAVIKKMTDAEGQFYNMQEVMAESVAGKWKNLQDAIDIMFSDMVEGNSELIKAPAEIMTKLVRNYESFALVLGLVATRMIGAKAASMMYTSIMGKEATALYANMSAEKAANVQSQLRINALNGKSVSSMKNLISTKALTAADIEQALAEKKITYEEARLLAVRLQANKANVKYMYSMQVITEKQKEMVLSGNAAVSTMGKMSIATSLLGVQLKRLAAQFLATASAMLANPITWVFAVVGAVSYLVSYFNDISEEQKKIADGMRDSLDDLNSKANEISGKVKLDFDNGKIVNSAGETKIAIEELVKFMRDTAPDANVMLNSIFELDDNGNYAKTLEERYQILLDYYNKVKNIASSGTEYDVQTDIQDAFDSTWGFGEGESVVTNAEDYIDSIKKAKKNILKAIADGGVEVRKLLQEQIKLSSSVNADDYVNKLLEPSNSAYLKSFKTKLMEATRKDNGMLGAVDIGGYVNDLGKSYDTYLSDLDQLAKEIESKMKAKFGDDVNLQDPNSDVRRSVILEVDSYLKQTETSEEVRKMLRNDYFEKYLNLKVDVEFNSTDAKEFWDSYLGKDIKYQTDDSALVGRVENAKKNIGTLNDDMNKYLKDYKNYSKYIKKNDDGTFANGVPLFMDQATIDKVEQAVKELNAMKITYDEYYKTLKEAGYTDEQIAAFSKKKAQGSQKDTLLEEWKEKFDKLKKTYAEFKKWAAVIGKDEAGKKVTELGMMNVDALEYFGLSDKDLSDPKKYDSAIKKFFDSIKSKLTTESRKKWSENLPVEMSGIELDISNEDIRKATEKFQQKFTEAMKQYDVWKSWFGLTGDNRLSTDIALNIKPMWNEKSKWMRDAFEKDAMSKGFKIDFAYDMTDEEAKQFFVGNKSVLLDTYKKVRDAFRDGGYDAAKSIADAVKGAVSTAEQIDAIDAKYNELIQQDKAITGGINVGTLESKRDAEKMVLDSNYKQFFSSVTSLTIQEAQSMGDAIKSNLLKQLTSGAITLDQYSQGVKKVDDQMKKSITRLKSLGQAILLGKTSEWYNQKYDEAKAKQETASQRTKDTQRAVNVATKKAESNNPKDVQELNDAIRDHIDATKDLEKATEELKKAEEDKDDNDKRVISDSEVNQRISKTQQVIKSFDELSKIASNLGANMDGFNDVLSLTNSVASSAQSGSTLATALGGSGYIGAIVGAIVGAVSYMSGKNRESVSEHEKEFEEDIKVVERFMKRLSDTIKESLTGIDSFVMDSATKARLEKYANDATKNYIEDRNAWDDSTNSKYKREAMLQSKKALESGSYYDTQLALLYQQREQLNNALETEQGSKSVDDSAVDDYRNQLEDLELEIRDFAKTMAEELYNIDFKGWADQLSETLVNAWRNGENAVQAYKNAVSDMLSSTLTSVISQKIIGNLLNDLAEELYADFEKNNGNISVDGQKILAKMYALVNEATTATHQALDESEKYMNEQGGTMKSWESSVGNSIQGVSEETADILASYINVMRSDLYTQRISVESINAMLASADYGLQKQYLQVEQQTRHLEAIENHTSSIRVATQELLYAFNQVCDGTQKIHIS